MSFLLVSAGRTLMLIAAQTFRIFFPFGTLTDMFFLLFFAVSYSLIPLFVLFLRLIVLPASEERFTRYLAYITVDKVGKVIYN